MPREMLFSSSEYKARLLGIEIADKAKLVRIGEVEEDFYRQEAVRQSELQRKDVPDGLIFPYNLDFQGFKLPLPVAVTLIKANEARNLISEDPKLNTALDFGIVNDAIWAIGDENGNLEDAINKTDSNRNHGDVQRLADFFSSQEGRFFYSVGSTATVNAENQVIEMMIRSLMVGQIKPHTVEEFNKIFGPDLRNKGAFSLDFVLHEGLLNLPNEFESTEQLVEIGPGGAMFSGRTEILIPNKLQYIRPMQLAAHGFPSNRSR